MTAKTKAPPKAKAKPGAVKCAADDYSAFLETKARRAHATGFECGKLTRKGAQYQLFDWQQHVVRIALKAGKFALFEDCGLGKSGQQLIWADEVCGHTGKPVLILCPLAVAAQTVAEGVKFGVKVTHVREAGEIGKKGIYITNYDRLEKFTADIARLGGIVLDESSLLKSFTGKTRIMLTQAFAHTEYKLCCTATPAPNDYTELGQHAEFLNVMKSSQMLATWFINDTADTGTWRLRKHARQDFWRWVGSWAACISLPSDIGFSDEGYALPPLELHNQSIAVDEVTGAHDGELFRASHVSAATLQKEARLSINERCARAAEIAKSEDAPCIIWCELNDESELLKKMLPEAIEIRGGDNEKKKERGAMWFIGGEMTYEELHSIGKEPKLAACGNQNTPSAEGNDTQTIQSIASVENPKAARRKKIKNTCEPITSQIPENSNESLSASLQLTPESESNTPPVRRCGNTIRMEPDDGSKLIQENESNSGSSHSESHWMTLNPCSPDRAEVAQSVDIPIEQDRVSSPPSITAIKQGESGDCYVHHAITDSVNSKTAPQTYAEPPNTFRALISKPEIFGFGMNMQACARQIFVGQSWSMERQYQAMRRSYRFGQTKPVHVHFITPSTLGDVRVRVREKFAAHETMKLEMKEAAKQMVKSDYVIDDKWTFPELSGDRWHIINGDCVAVARKFIADSSVGLSIFSPPFADLFTYSSRTEDMGNCASMEDFMKHFRYQIAELFRVTMPGRECAVHCGDLLSTKWKTGTMELQDFSGAISQAFRDVGFLFQSRITIWKSPVTEMQRTKAHGLLYKTLKKDSSNNRVGMPDYLMVFRKPGENTVPISHTESDFSLADWQEIASPVWMTIEQGNVLNRKGSKEAGDERHICPLQLDVIERVIKLWSAPGDLVYSPFTGIGSEGYQAIKMQRRFIGSELKASYFKDAAQWLKQAESERELFTLGGEPMPSESAKPQPAELFT